MSYLDERPTKTFGAPKPSELALMGEQSEEKVERAKVRLRIARYCGMTEGSLRQKRRQIKHMMRTGFLPGGSPPARETIRRLETKWNEGGRSWVDYLDKPRTGRKRKAPLPKPIEQAIEQAIKGGDTNAAQVLDSLQDLAEALGAKDRLTYYQVHRRFAEAGRLRRAASRHGAKSGLIDGTPHSRIAAKYSNDTWAMDELAMPVFTCQWEPKLREWISVRLDVVLIIDLKSTAVVAWHIADPKDRLDEEGYRMTSGVTTDDVLGTFLMGACPELAPSSTAEMAGYLPRTIRWDNAQTHKSTAAIFDEAELGIETRRLPKRSPWLNGSAENRVGMLKELCWNVRGHVDRYLPTDRVTNDATADLPRDRSVKVASGNREARKQPIAPEQLLSVEELRLVFDEIVRRYNYRHVNSVFNQTPVDRYLEHRNPRSGRNGRDLVYALDSRTTTVSVEDGLVHYSDNKRHHYMPTFEGVMLLPDTPVTYYADPLHRGVWVDLHTTNELHFVEPIKNDKEYGQEIARAKWLLARKASDEGAAVRRGRMIAELGEEGLAYAEERYEEAQKQLKEKKKNGESKRDEPGPQNTSRRGDEVPPAKRNLPSPWGRPADDFIRSADEGDSSESGEVE